MLAQWLKEHWLLATFWGILLGFGGYQAVKNWARIRQFLIDVREELKKCSWPTWQELRESTTVVAVSVVVLGVFVFYADLIFNGFFSGILYACDLRDTWLSLKR